MGNFSFARLAPPALLVAAALVLVAGLTGLSAATQGDDAMSLTVTSTAFAQGGSIPVKYTCDGPDLIPPLSISGVPDAARSLAIIMDDPDAPMGTWDHWVVFNLPPGFTELGENETLPEVAVGGQNSWGRIGWGGPCPPPGKPHRYFFKAYALDTDLNLPRGASKSDVEQAMKGHTLAQGELMGTYGR